MYRYINAMGKELPVLCFKLLDKSHLKSNSYYLLVLTGKIPSLKVLKIKQSTWTAANHEVYKYMTKGLMYMQQNGNSLDKLEFSQIVGHNMQDYMLPILKT